nr:uncharacterized protein LOC124813372 [Hydra vulgaris]
MIGFDLIFWTGSNIKNCNNNRKNCNNVEIKIKTNNKQLYSSRVIKYLGVLIDCNLSWNFHIDELRKKLNGANESRLIHTHSTQNINNGKLIVPSYKTQNCGKNSVVYRCIC